MATKPLIDFLLAATKDNSLRDEVKDAANFDTIVKLAERRGYHVTSDDLGTAMGKFRWLTDDQLISEFGLEANQLEPIFGLFGLSASFPEHRELTDAELGALAGGDGCTTGLLSTCGNPTTDAGGTKCSGECCLPSSGDIGGIGGIKLPGRIPLPGGRLGPRPRGPLL